MFGTSAYKKITFGKFETKVLATPGDGDCMLHALARALYPAYTSGVRHGRKITPKQVVREMREGLLKKLERKDPQTGLSGYEQVGDGSYAAVGFETTQMSYLREILGGTGQLGEEVKVLIEHFIHCNILLIDAKTKRLHSKYGFNPDWDVVVFYHTTYRDGEGVESGHFELVVQDEEILTPRHPFVVYLLNN